MWVWVLVFDIIGAAILFLLFYRRRKDVDYNSNTINYDEDMREFCYFVPKSQKTIREYLARHSRSDTINYFYDPEKDIVLFYPDLSNIPEVCFDLHMRDIRGGTALRIVQQEDYERQSTLALRQNEFWHKKLNAFPMPYEQEE